MIALDEVGLDAFIDEHFPQARNSGAVLEEVAEDFVRVRQRVGDMNLRPGGTLSGPTLMTLADHAMYLLVLSKIGPVPLAVTTNLTIDFLRRPELTDVIAIAELLKLGKRLAVGRVTMRSEGDPRPIAHATLTYSIPPRG